MKQGDESVRVGWTSALAKIGLIVLLFETITGLAITFFPFHPYIQWSVVVHTLIGVVTLFPVAWYYARHWNDYKRYALSHVVLLGYVGLAALLVCSVTGIVLTWQGLFGIKTSPVWRRTHLISTFAVLATALPHIVIVFFRVARRGNGAAARRYLVVSGVGTGVGLVLIGILTLLYAGQKYVNEFPEDYSYVYGEDRPFAPSLARTDTGGAFDARSLSGSETCGTQGCHQQIVEEWQPSSHRYSAMDKVFQSIQTVMAKQNGPESTRYCGGCHDPISLFSGTKNIFTENLTNLQGYQEGISCLVCHSIRETDLQGNANYVVTQPSEYLWQWSTSGMSRVLRDFLIRTYPDEHNKLSKRLFKAPEYCAACHKQFIDQEINQVGWVQLQNQYDNWAASHWNVKGDPTKTIECRECHMPLVDSTDPAAGDSADYNRSPDDGKHRSHRFVASNNMMPRLLGLPGWEEQVRLTNEWLQGKTEVPEIQDKWGEGPLVTLSLDLPEKVTPGETFPVRVIMSSNKVGHDFPTGPLDIIQSWLEIYVKNEAGDVIFASGRRDEKNFIEPGSFLFKVEPVDQYGNLIDRHNLWEMVGVRYRRSLFPGYSDTAEYLVACPSSLAMEQAKAKRPEGPASKELTVRSPDVVGVYEVTAILNYRKVDQFLLNFLYGENSGLTSPVVEIARATGKVEVRRPEKASTKEKKEEEERRVSQLPE